MSHNRDLSAAAAQIGFHSSNIGIGTDNPGSILTLDHATNPAIQLRDSGTKVASINSEGTQTNIASFEGKDLVFATSGSSAFTERLRITSDGKMGLGTQTPDKLLTVSGANTVARFKSSTSYVDLIFQNTGATNGFIQYGNAGDFKFYANSGSTPTLTIKSGSPGNVGINETDPSHVLDVKSKADGTYFINGQNHNGNNIFQVYESSDGDGNHGMLYLNNGSGTTLTKISTNGYSYFNGGSVGINIATPDRKLEVVDTNSNGSYPLAVSNFINATANKGAAIDFRLTTGGNSRGEIGCKWTSNSSSDGTSLYFAPNDGSTGNVERLRLTYDGKFGFNTTNPGAFDSGANHLVLLGNTSGTGNAGITIASGTSSYGNIYFADGTSGADAYRGHIAYNHNGNTMRFATNGSEKVRILSSGFVNIGNGYLTNSNSGLHVGRSSGGTAAGESVLAATLGNGSTMNNAVFTVKNAGDRGSQGHASGSPLAKFEFNNGTAFEVNKNGQVTTPYQPAFMAKLSAATGQNFNGTLIFNSVNHNIGNHYNSSNGRFTAPVAGRYLFNWYTNVDTNSNSTSLWGDWLINGSYSNYRFYTYVTHTGWELLTASIIFSLSSGDYVNVYVSTSGNYDGGSYGSFNGCLLG